jgi:hypothetical protein
MVALGSCSLSEPSESAESSELFDASESDITTVHSCCVAFSVMPATT